MDESVKPGETGDFAQDRILSDIPIALPEQDLLDRAAFCHELAISIASTRGPTSLVVGIEAGWGDGKTSAKNLILHELQAMKPAVSVMEFNPWRYASQDQIAIAFFAGLLDLFESVVAGRGWTRRARSRLLRYARHLVLADSLLGDLAQLVRAVGGILMTFGLVVAVPDTVVRPVGLALVVVGALATFIRSVGEHVALWVADADRRSADTMRNDVRNVLAELRKPVLVVVDDIDRLAPEEMKTLVQLVKANADFPNTTYLLLFQRSDVADGLSTALGGIDGSAYLDKIVQVELSLPSANEEQVHKVLFDGLDRLIGELDAEEWFDSQRWSVLFRACGGYFSNVRSVTRFLNSMRLRSRLALDEGGSFNLDFVDLFGLEVLRVFESAVYERLPELKPALTMGAGAQWFGMGSEEAAKAALLGTVESSGNPDAVRDLLSEIFPNSSWAFGASHAAADYADWTTKMRAASRDYFDDYFSFTLARHQTSRSELSEFVGLCESRSDSGAYLVMVREAGKWKSLVHLLRSQLSVVPVKCTEALVGALFDTGDELPDELPSMTLVDAETLATFLLVELIERLPPASRLVVMDRSAQTARGIRLPISMYWWEKHRRRPESSHEPLLSDDDLKQYADTVLALCQAAAGDGRVLGTRHAGIILRVWHELDEDSLTTWIRNVVVSQEAAVHLLNAYARRIVSSGDRGSTIRWRVSLDELEAVIELSAIDRHLQGLAEDAVATHDGRGVRAYRNARRRRDAGVSEDDPRFDD